MPPARPRAGASGGRRRWRVGSRRRPVPGGGPAPRSGGAARRRARRTVPRVSSWGSLCGQGEEVQHRRDRDDLDVVEAGLLEVGAVLGDELAARAGRGRAWSSRRRRRSTVGEPRRGRPARARSAPGCSRSRRARRRPRRGGRARARRPPSRDRRRRGCRRTRGPSRAAVGEGRSRRVRSRDGCRGCRSRWPARRRAPARTGDRLGRPAQQLGRDSQFVGMADHDRHDGREHGVGRADVGVDERVDEVRLALLELADDGDRHSGPADPLPALAEP